MRQISARWCLLLLTGLVLCSTAWAKKPVFVSLSYDDALPSQLKYAIPALNARGLKASFYLVPANPGFGEQWRQVAEAGHELGNHTFTHPCRSDMPDRDWVTRENDLASISVDDMIEQVKQSNLSLAQLDGRQSRTFTPPCGDKKALDGNYLIAIAPLVAGIKGVDLSPSIEAVWAPESVNGDALIAYLTEQPYSVEVISIIFHGIGGDYLSVNDEAHQQLLDYLVAHPDRYQVDTYFNIRRHLSNPDA